MNPIIQATLALVFSTLFGFGCGGITVWFILSRLMQTVSGRRTFIRTALEQYPEDVLAILQEKKALGMFGAEGEQ